MSAALNWCSYEQAVKTPNTCSGSAQAGSRSDLRQYALSRRFPVCDHAVRNAAVVNPNGSSPSFREAEGAEFLGRQSCRSKSLFESLAALPPDEFLVGVLPHYLEGRPSVLAPLFGA